MTGAGGKGIGINLGFLEIPRLILPGCVPVWLSKRHWPPGCERRPHWSVSDSPKCNFSITSLQLRVGRETRSAPWRAYSDCFVDRRRSHYDGYLDLGVSPCGELSGNQWVLRSRRSPDKATPSSRRCCLDGCPGMPDWYFGLFLYLKTL